LELYDGAKKVAALAKGPAVFSVKDLTAGYHAFSVLGTDGRGNVRPSDPVLVVVRREWPGPRDASSLTGSRPHPSRALCGQSSTTLEPPWHISLTVRFRRHAWMSASLAYGWFGPSTWCPTGL